MTINKIWRISSLTPDDLLEFLKSRKGRLPGEPPAESTLRHWLCLFEQMWRNRGEYIASLNFDPAPFHSEVVVKCKPLAFKRFKAIPEKAALALIHDALNWLENEAEFIYRTISRYWKISHEVGLSRRQRGKRVRPLFDELRGDQEFTKIWKKLGKNLRAHEALSRAVSHTMAAVMILLLFTVGMRNRELCRLDVNCVRTKISEDGSIVQYLSGIAAKKGGALREWAISEPLSEGVRFIEKMFSSIRQSENSRPLFVNGAPLRLKRGTLRFVPTNLPNRIRQFANAPYRQWQPKIQRLHPHACRKTFAVFVTKRDKSALEPLAWQFGHAYSEFTDGVYVGSDIELTEMLAEADQEELVRALECLLSSDHLAGKAGVALIERRAELIGASKFKGKNAIKALVGKLIAQGVVIAPCDWGYCVYSKSHSACDGTDSGPNPLLRAPDVCARCSNFAVTTEYRRWWDERAKRDHAFLKNSSLPEQTVSLVTKRLSVTMKVLRGLQTGATSHAALDGGQSDERSE
ncbi:site-specific integrase [Janthinobacterium sp. RT4P48]|uniref:site-specific integrase n=1 Tax=Janthinobacterium sp. RT4P48 TaxID=3424188 RepID=UPI003F26E4F8